MSSENRKEQCRVSKRKWYAANKEESIKRANMYKEKNLDRVKNSQAKYRKYHPDKLWIGAIKQRAKEKGLEFSITEKDVIIPEFCPILGIPLFRVGKTHSPNSPSLDHIDSTKGYIKGNIQVISHRANILKNSATLSELVILGEWAKIQILEDECLTT